ncbi:MAG: hypothetical protein QOE97_1778 [Pseudonocardiales bacterium]|nr:hypothetical protein [Pseudonocardiales bacterium]
MRLPTASRPSCGLRSLGLGTVLVLLLSVGVAWQASPATAAVAPGCTSARPTKIGGQIFSYPHAYSVDAFVGVGLQDANYRALKPDGSASAGGYTYTQWVNSTLPAYGDPAKGGQRSWGPLCVAAGVHYASVEVSAAKPINRIKYTDETYYGTVGELFNVVAPAGGSYDVTIRMPEAQTLSSPAAFSQTTGSLQGYVKCGSGCGRNAGKMIPTSAISPVRAFPNARAAACGIEGEAVSADVLGPSSYPPNGLFLRIDQLAGGQCGAATQSYSLRVTCSSFCSPTGARVTKTLDVGVRTKGVTPFGMVF